MFFSQIGITQLLIFVILLCFLSLSYILYFYLKYKNNLLNFLVVEKFRKIKWSNSHIGSACSKSAKRSHLGAGGIYYGIVQSNYSKVAVVLGSGAGFVPKIIAQAQRDAGMKDACTYYVDADINIINPYTGQEYDQPILDEVTLDKNLFLLQMRSSYAAKLFEKENIKIDYLHIDGDHSVKGILEDWRYFNSLLSQNAIITFHDYSSVPDVKIALKKIKESYPQMQIITFPKISAGIALAQLSSVIPPLLTDIKSRGY